MNAPVDFPARHRSGADFAPLSLARSRRRRAAVQIAAVAVVSILAAGVLAQQNQDFFYVAVSDGRGRPVTDLTAADFQVAVDDRPQEVLALERATEPAAVVLLTDRLGAVDAYSYIDLQRALSSFVKTVRAASPGSTFALTTFDGPVVRVASFAMPPAELDRMIGRLTTITPDAAPLDALADASRLVGSAASRRRIIFLVFGAYRADTSTIAPEVAAAMLQASGASLWTIEARVPRQGTPGEVNRENVVDRGSAISGGRREIVSSAVGVETMARRLGTLIGSQYRLTYGPGGGSANSQRKVTVRRAGVHVHAPGWLAR
jgi:hypothetical protein